MIYAVDYRAAILFIGLIAVIVPVNYFLSPRIRRHSLAYAEASSDLNAGTIDVLTNISVTHLYTRKHFEIERNEELTDNLKYKTRVMRWQTELIVFVNSALLFIFSMGIFWVLIRSWEVGALSTGEMILVFTLMSTIFSILDAD